jgi:hypothetical protein
MPVAVTVAKIREAAAAGPEPEIGVYGFAEGFFPSRGNELARS